jgi:hypothetical protein
MYRYLIYLGYGIWSVFQKRVVAWMQRKRELRDEEKRAKQERKNKTIIHVLERPPPSPEEPPRLVLSGAWWCQNISTVSV